MPLGTLEGKQGMQIPVEEALNMTWAKNGQLLFEMDIMKHQLNAFEQENKKLKEEIDELKNKKKK